MTLLITHLLAVAIGALGAGAYARHEISKIKRDDLSFRMAPVIEVAARQVG